MRYLVLSDLHANREALEAVLADARGEYDRILCCGDLVGYGADPDFIVEWSRENLHAPANHVIRGNHDRACAGMEDLEWFSPLARASCLWTMKRLARANAEYLRGLPAGPLLIEDSGEGFQLAHGSPLDEDEYLTTLNEASYVLTRLDTSLVFFGHTHLQGAFTWLDARYTALGRPAPDESRMAVTLHRDAACLFNPGSVGQPRDGDPRAAYALFDSATRDLVQCRVIYDWETAGRKIAAAGLPPALASRLAAGQ